MMAMKPFQCSKCKKGLANRHSLSHHKKHCRLPTHITTHDFPNISQKRSANMDGTRKRSIENDTPSKPSKNPRIQAVINEIINKTPQKESRTKKDIVGYSDEESSIDESDDNDYGSDNDTLPPKIDEDLGEEADVQPEAKTPEVADVCHAIANAAGDWAGKILDAECWIDVEVGFNGKYFRSALETAIKRQEFDGFLSLHEAAELCYITDVRLQLLRHLSIYNVGDQYVKKNILKLMLVLYDLKKLNARILHIVLHVYDGRILL